MLSHSFYVCLNSIRTGLLKGLVTPQNSTAKRTAAGAPELQRSWHDNVTEAYSNILQYNTKIVGGTIAHKLMVHTIFNLDEECLQATGKTIKVVGSADRKKHENQNGTSRTSISMIRCGCPALRNASGPTFFFMKGSARRESFTTEFLLKHGAATGSEIIMTENAYLTDDAWREINPKLCDGLRAKVRAAAKEMNVDSSTADQLKIVLSLDGFKSHTNNFKELIHLHKHNIMVLCEERDSSHVNQAFDKYVVSAVLICRTCLSII